MDGSKTSEKNWKGHLIDLIKYPILVFSIVIAIVVLKLFLGLEFGVVTELSTSGLKFAERSNDTTLKAITELETSLNDATVRIESLEQQLTDLKNNSGETLTSNPDNDIEAENYNLKAFSAAQFVSDSTANIASLRSGLEQKTEKLVGYIWIGNYQNKWQKMNLVWGDNGRIVDIKPQEMVPGTSYNVLGNMVLRDGLPPNNSEYYKARKNIGVIPRGKQITLLSLPEMIDREFANQYWAKVEYIPQ